MRMAPKKYYCDYCDKQFQDTPSDRKRHSRGIMHQQAKARWYHSFNIQPSSLSIPPICVHFLNTGFCRFGDSCKYTHPNPNNNTITSQVQQQGSVVRDRMGVSWGNLPPSLYPPPEAGYPSLPSLDWG